MVATVVTAGTAPATATAAAATSSHSRSSRGGGNSHQRSTSQQPKKKTETVEDEGAPLAGPRDCGEPVPDRRPPGRRVRSVFGETVAGCLWVAQRARRAGCVGRACQRRRAAAHCSSPLARAAAAHESKGSVLFVLLACGLAWALASSYFITSCRASSPSWRAGRQSTARTSRARRASPRSADSGRRHCSAKKGERQRRTAWVSDRALYAPSPSCALALSSSLPALPRRAGPRATRLTCSCPAPQRRRAARACGGTS